MAERRMAGRGPCADCKYFEHGSEEPELDKGTCRRFPPVPSYDPESGEGVTVWALVDWMDWCGEFVESEEAHEARVRAFAEALGREAERAGD